MCVEGEGRRRQRQRENCCLLIKQRGQSRMREEQRRSLAYWTERYDSKTIVHYLEEQEERGGYCVRSCRANDWASMCCWLAQWSVDFATKSCSRVFISFLIKSRDETKRIFFIFSLELQLYRYRRQIFVPNSNFFIVFLVCLVSLSLLLSLS